ncbi:HTH-type transcriptional regulator NorG [Ferriphaselus amnicola]|uniref:HTH-type transcriptional regulator NorG n=1 Tax=Ferriphaselus amnicola TaxID=1188319 RepID=A0A2Z6GBU2_9PROT|nr:PLP-dependent aminotransferase family protein [Ferriphaselus amnicola]BBE50936.1 HTH-type transcriptional regulator NorG [Ferriphaselus amnicola]
MKRYEQLADDIAHSIREGLLARGEKLPSVRQASAARKVSPSTVFQAYYLLEARGLISARERSGYYVSGGTQHLPPLPEPDINSTPEATQVDVSELVFEVLESTRARKVVPLGSAFPSPLLFPMARLAKTMAACVQAMDPWRSVEDISPGDAELRRQIALRYMIDGLQVSPDEIVITNGALEGLNLCLQAVTQPGDTVLIGSPTFYAALQAIERNGLKAVDVPCHPRDGIDLAALQRALELHKPTACWLMTNFQNPLGSLMPDDKKKDMVTLLARHNVPLIEDDVYGELYFGDQRPKPAKAFDTAGLVMHCSSFSKCLAPGYRVGWAAPGRYAKTVERLKLTTTLATSVPAQITLAGYLKKGGYDKHLRGLRHTLLLQQIKFVAAIERHFPAGTRLTSPSGGYFLWVKLPDGVNSLELHREALKNGISIAPGPIFSAHKGSTDYVRLNYGHLWSDEMEGAIAALGQIIHRLSMRSA